MAQAKFLDRHRDSAELYWHDAWEAAEVGGTFAPGW